MSKIFCDKKHLTSSIVVRKEKNYYRLKTAKNLFFSYDISSYFDG